MVVITQNIDRLHHQAGSRDVIELHGSLFDTECTKCGDVRENRDSPIVPALKDKGLVLHNDNKKLLSRTIITCYCRITMID